MGEVALQLNSHRRRKSKARGAESAVLPSVRHDVAETEQSKGRKNKRKSWQWKMLEVKLIQGRHIKREAVRDSAAGAFRYFQVLRDCPIESAMAR